MTTQQEAAQRAEDIRLGLQQTGVLYAQAVAEHDWQVLGYTSITQWARCEFGPDRFSTQRRKEIVGLLTDAGLTQRQIAAATGASQPTIMRDQRARDTSESPGQPNVDTVQTQTASGPGPDFFTASAQSGDGPTPGNPRQQAARDREARRRTPAQSHHGSAHMPDGWGAQVERARLIGAICDQVIADINAVFADTEGENLTTRLAHLEENLGLLNGQRKQQLAAALQRLAGTASAHHDRIILSPAERAAS